MADGSLSSVDAEFRIQRDAMAAIRADEDVRRVFGVPPRVYDDETRGPAYPYANLERHETRPAGSAGVAGIEHTLTLSVSSRFGGRAYTKEAVGALRAAVERAEVSPDGQRIVLIYAAYGDVFRTSDQQTFRGILRIRIISEEIV